MPLGAALTACSYVHKVALYPVITATEPRSEGKSGVCCSTRTCRPRRYHARRRAGCAHPVRRLEDTGPGRPSGDPGVPHRRRTWHYDPFLLRPHRQGAERGDRADRLGRTGGQDRVRSAALLTAQTARPSGQCRRDVHPPRGRAPRAARLAAARAGTRPGHHAAPHAVADGPANADEGPCPGGVAYPGGQDDADRRPRPGGRGHRCARGAAAVLRRARGPSRVRRRRGDGTGGARRTQGLIAGSLFRTDCAVACRRPRRARGTCSGSVLTSGNAGLGIPTTPSAEVGTTTAHTRSPGCRSGTPMTATSATPRWVASTFSTSRAVYIDQPEIAGAQPTVLVERSGVKCAVDIAEEASISRRSRGWGTKPRVRYRDGHGTPYWAEVVDEDGRAGSHPVVAVVGK